jgi:hypothetical protein
MANEEHIHCALSPKTVMKVFLVVLAIVLWLVLGVAGFVFLLNVLGGVWTPIGNPSRVHTDAILDQSLSVGLKTTPYALIVTVAAVAALCWPKKRNKTGQGKVS